MRLLFLSLLCCFALMMTAFATEDFSYTLQKHQKFEESFSVNIGEDATIHLLILRNKEAKQYDLVPFYIDASETVRELETLTFEDIPEIISYHQRGHIISLVSHFESTLEVFDIDTTTGAHVKSTFEDFEKPETVFIQKDQTLLVSASRKGESVSVFTIESSASTFSSELNVPENLQKKIKIAFKDIEAINTNEHVKFGSIAVNQAYFDKGSFYMVLDSDEDNNLETIVLKPNEDTPVLYRDFTANTLEKGRDSNSYIFNSLLYSILLSREDLKLNIYDLNTGEELKSMLLSQELKGIKDLDEKKAKFLKGANKNKMKPTITVNATVDDNLEVTLNYVDKYTYNYYNNWFWMHQMMFQQQMMMQHNMARPGGFGPNDTPFAEVDAAFFKKEITSITFILSRDLELLPDAAGETVFKPIDKEKHLETISDLKGVHNSTAGFLPEAYHYMYTDKRAKVVHIKIAQIEEGDTAIEE